MENKRMRIGIKGDCINFNEVQLTFNSQQMADNNMWYTSQLRYSVWLQGSTHLNNIRIERLIWFAIKHILTKHH